jgi:acylphosphatase
MASGEDRPVKAVHVIVRGRVQGVGFRWHVREAARRASVGGWVRNRADGTVEMLFAGEPSAVDRVIEAVRTGPPAARVDGLEVRPAASTALPSTFSVQ